MNCFECPNCKHDCSAKHCLIVNNLDDDNNDDIVDYVLCDCKVWYEVPVEQIPAGTPYNELTQEERDKVDSYDINAYQELLKRGREEIRKRLTLYTKEEFDNLKKGETNE